jgi:hypothetical protein
MNLFDRDRRNRKTFFQRIKEFECRLIKRKIPLRFVFIITGILSTAWFLVRVIPKPSRAAYPCMRLAAPAMSGFVTYLLFITGSFFAFKKAKNTFLQSKYMIAILFGIMGVVTGFIALTANSKQSAAQPVQNQDSYTPNQPIGQGKGVFPGRVVWIWNPDATNEDCTNTHNGDDVCDTNDDGYFLNKNSDQAVIDKMIDQTVFGLTGECDAASAWDALFRHFNKKKHGIENGYSAGEKVFIKINATSTWYGGSNASITNELDRFPTENYAISETSPQVVLSILRQLVNDAGVKQQDIYVGDPIHHIYNDNYKMWSAEFPDVVYLDNKENRFGRTKVVVNDQEVVQYSDNGAVLGASSDKLYQIFHDASYLINLAALKGHIRAGITLCTKNHFGSHTRNSAVHLHPGLVRLQYGEYRNKYKQYRVLVDIMGHPLLGGNTVLFLVDGLWGGPHEIGKPMKWQTPPFNNDWSSSIIASQDQVALESVCFDLLRTEYDGSYIDPKSGEPANFPNYGAVDDYLHQAAADTCWPAGVLYDPDGDFVPIQSLGVHEHWNNSSDKMYSRNLGEDRGIELYTYPKTLVERDTINYPGCHENIKSNELANQIKLYPNPVNDFVNLEINNDFIGNIQINIFSLSGVKLSSYQSKKTTEQFKLTLNCNRLKPDIYILKIILGDKMASIKIRKLGR